MAETNGRIKSLLVPKIKTLDLTMFLVYLFLICALRGMWYLGSRKGKQLVRNTLEVGFLLEYVSLGDIVM